MRIRENLIYLPALLMDMSTSSAILGMPFYASELGASSFIIGLIASINTLVYMTFTRVFGKLSDCISRKAVPQISCFCFSALYLLMPRCKELIQLAVLFPFTGLFLAGFWPSLEAMVGEMGTMSSLGKRVMAFNIAWNSGVIIGYATSGYIYEMHHSIPFYFASAGSLCSALLVTAHTHSPQDQVSYETIVLSPKAKAFVYIGWTANFSSWLTLGVLRYIFPKLISELGIQPSVFGLLMVCWATTQAMVFIALGTVTRWQCKFRFLALAQMLGCLGLLIIWLTYSPRSWAFALFLFGLCTGMTYFSSIYYSLSGHADLGNKTGWHEAILSSGGFFGPFIAGVLSKYIDIKAPYLFCSVVIVISLVMQSLMIRRLAKK